LSAPRGRCIFAPVGPLPRSVPDAASAALDSLLSRFEGVVRTIAARYRLAPTDRDDLVQEVRVRLWRALEVERIDAVPASYLYRTASSAALDLIRRRRTNREDPLDDLAPTDHSLADGAARPDERAERADLAFRIGQAIEEIPETRRAAVRMYLAGYGSGEIGALMGWTEAKARNLLYRGLADLRARLEAMGIVPDAHD
jgi:RNA polymerase sigma factor (sigma-70 family)